MLETEEAYRPAKRKGKIFGLVGVGGFIFLISGYIYFSNFSETEVAAWIWTIAFSITVFVGLGGYIWYREQWDPNLEYPPPW